MQASHKEYLGVFESRLAKFLEKRHHIFGAMLVPRFKVDWVQDKEKCMQYRLMLKREFQTLISDESAARDSSQTCGAFITNCMLFFFFPAATNFGSEAAKVAYAITHLTGRARL